MVYNLERNFFNFIFNTMLRTLWITQKRKQNNFAVGDVTLSKAIQMCLLLHILFLTSVSPVTRCLKIMLSCVTSQFYKILWAPMGIASKTIAYSLGVIGTLNVWRNSEYDNNIPFASTDQNSMVVPCSVTMISVPILGGIVSMSFTL